MEDTKEISATSKSTAGTEPTKSRATRSRQIQRISVSLLLVLAITGCVYFFLQSRNKENQLKNPAAVAQQQTQELVSKVDQLTTLPSGEQPTVATVSDVSKLSDQTFFANAKNGDKVLIYSQAKKAYLYRPSTDKVINIAPLNINNSQ